MDLFGIGLPELLLILVVALIVFGPGRLPEIAAALGRTLRQLRQTSSEITQEFLRPEDKEVTPQNKEGKEDRPDVASR